MTSPRISLRRAVLARCGLGVLPADLQVGTGAGGGAASDDAGVGRYCGNESRLHLLR